MKWQRFFVEQSLLTSTLPSLLAAGKDKIRYIISLIMIHSYSMIRVHPLSRILCIRNCQSTMYYRGRTTLGIRKSKVKRTLSLRAVRFENREKLQDGNFNCLNIREDRFVHLIGKLISTSSIPINFPTYYLYSDPSP